MSDLNQLEANRPLLSSVEFKNPFSRVLEKMKDLPDWIKQRIANLRKNVATEPGKVIAEVATFDKPPVGVLQDMQLEDKKALPFGDWREILPALLPYTDQGERNPLSENFSNTTKNPFWEKTPLRKGCENHQMPFGLLDPRSLKDWGMDYAGALKFNNELLALFDHLKEKVDPNMVDRLVKQMDMVTQENPHASYANNVVTKIWKNVYGSGPDNPRSIDVSALPGLTLEADQDPMKAVAQLLTLRAYFSAAIAPCYSSIHIQDYPADSTSDDIKNRLIEDAFLLSYGTEFSRDSEKGRFSLTMDDLNEDGQKLFEQFKVLYIKLFNHPLLTASSEAEYIIDRKDEAESPKYERLYRSLSSDVWNEHVRK